MLRRLHRREAIVYRRLGLLTLVALVLTLPSRGAAAATPVRVAFTRHFNVFLMNAAGTNTTTVTSRGTGYQGTYYPWYQWSFDGKYLLLVRSEPLPKSQRRQHLLLLDPAGHVLRDLAILPQSADFFPTWALDANQIAYVASENWPKSASAPLNTVNVADVLGNTHVAWRYRSTGEGCGGGSPDPADAVYWQETGFGGTPPSMQWSISRHQAIYSASCAGGLYLTDTRTRSTRALGQQGSRWNEAAISRAGKLAAVVETCPKGICSRRVVLVNLNSGAIVRSIAAAQLPRWSADGQTLYFVKRVGGRTLHLQDESGNKYGFQTETSEIWRANGDGSHQLRLLSEDAYGFGPLSLTPDGHSIIFSRVDNDWGIFQHRLAGNRYTTAIVAKYGPKAAIQRFDSGHLPIFIANDAGSPAVQP
jgi:Tol biopolymer transport system component